jgi:putative endopeptidase
MAQQQIRPISWRRSALSACLVLALTCCAAAQTSKPFDVAAHEAFDVSDLDSSRNPCQDFDGFVNAKWKAANPIPNDRSAWGAIYQMQEDSQNVQHEIVEAAARDAAQAKPGSIEQKIGWLYASDMDEDAIEKAGFTPIKPKLLKIAALESVSDVVGYLVQTFADGDPQVFDFSSYADFKDARMRIAYAQQKCGWLSSPDRCRQGPGLGLPTRDYYLDDKYQKIRDAYLSYIGKTLELTGVPADDAKQQAAQVLSFETELAKASFSPVELRQPENQYHLVTIAEADQVTPHFHWETFFAAQGVSVGKGFSLSQPKFFAEFDKLLAEAPVEQWRAYLRFHVIDNASPYLSRTFSDNKFEFYGKTLSGQPEQSLRWKRVLESVNDSMGEGLGQLYVARVFKREADARREYRGPRRLQHRLRCVADRIEAESFEDQRFFLSGARAMRANVREQATLRQLNTNPHAPWSVRLVGSVSNVDAFAEAFHCKAGDAMVRTGEKQVKIW